MNIQNWKWKDATATLRILTVNNTVISPGGFAVICQDSVKLKSMIPDLQGMILQTVWSQLNNSGDNVILIKQDNSRSDSVNFNSSWGGSSEHFHLRKKLRMEIQMNQQTGVHQLHCLIHTGKNKFSYTKTE